MLKDKIKKEIEKVIKDLGLESVDFVIEHPDNMKYGDFACNVAMVLGGNRELAEKIVQKLSESNLNKMALKISVAGPGFINISIKNHVLIKEASRVLKGNFVGKYKNRKVMVEFTDPNPFKEFHIGHVYSNIVGESISRLIEVTGGNVKRACYQGDVGMHVAKSLYGMIKKMKDDGVNIDKLKKKSLKHRQKFMGQAYVLGANAYEDDKNSKKEIEDLNEKIYSQAEEIKELYELGRKWSLEYFDEIYKRLGTKFDEYFFERDAGKIGLKLVKDNLREVFEKSKGAIIFKGGKYGLHTRVFVNKLGLPTYEAKDLGLAFLKREKYKYDNSIIITGNEVNEYFKVVLKALSKIDLDLSEKTLHIGHGMVRLPEGKMSSRTGKIITGEWLLNESKKRALEIMKDSDFVDDRKDDIGEEVGKSAIKYALLKTGIGNDVIFDFKSSVDLEGDSGPYLQYTYARCNSVLSKADLQGRSLQANLQGQAPDLIGTGLKIEEKLLIKTLYRFEEVLLSAVKELAPNLVCNFLHDLAQKYNSFYNKHSILNADKKEQKDFRLWLTMATGEILRQGLQILGIKVLEKM